jgi:DNA primase
MFLDRLLNSAHESIYRYEPVIQYLKSRNVFDEDIKKFRIGYSRIVSVQDDGTPDYTRFMEDSWRGKRFENKVLFPLLDVMGQASGVIGRAYDSKAFKIYATDSAKISGFFFGLFQALPYIYREKKVYVVEGPFDTIAFSKVAPNTVGSLTAGINDIQYELLMAFCDRIVTVFDSDKPGIEATEKASHRKNVSSIFLGTSYKDPDECLMKLTLPGFKNYMSKKFKENSLW